MKTIAIHQPNYIPWTGYFYKISKADLFVILDHVDIITGSASAITNRTRLNGNGVPVMLTIPIRKGSKAINEVKIDYNINWTKKHINTISNLYSKTDFFNSYFPELVNVFSKKHELLSMLNIELISMCCDWLGITTPVVLSSELDHKELHKSELLVRICSLLQADTYLSGNGARKYNDIELFENAGIDLKYSSFKPVPYKQRSEIFVSGLSILDALFNLGPQAKNLLNDSQADK